MTPQVPGLRWLGRALERLMFGSHARLYRQFVRAVVLVTVVLVLANAVVRVGSVDVAPGTVAVLETAGAIAIAAFVVVGTLQLLVLARVLDRESTNVATQAATLEAHAGEVTDTADELATTADELEARADKLESAAETLAETATEADVGQIEGKTQDELAAQASQLRDEAASLRAETADAKAQSEDVKKTTEDVSDELASERERLPGEPDPDAVDEPGDATGE
ncbi:hypothetical protein ACFR9U_05350 [Halorientalis brevis]|uniref:Uncharacterized protein n=1 Tax=Halorientalis brevis TaxID=1126241 RepID=A0ABD6C7X8_9EURY|nr:hypothetical protein [Halorientalis brevis]